MALSHLSPPEINTPENLNMQNGHLLHETERLGNKKSQRQNLMFLLCLLEDKLRNPTEEPGAIISQCFYKTG